MKISVIMAACNAGPLLLQTCREIGHATDGSQSVEIIIVNDQSTDGCCERAQEFTANPVRVISTPERAGCSGARHLGGQYATGDVIMISDPHCRFPRGVIHKLAMRAASTMKIVQPFVDMHGHVGRSYATLRNTDIGLRLRIRARWTRYPIMIGSIYLFNRDVWDAIGQYPVMPGWWGQDETYISLIAYRLGIRIITARDLPKCEHLWYRKLGVLPFSIPDNHARRNIHWMHAVCLPRNYEKHYKGLLDASHRVDMTEDFSRRQFLDMREHVLRRATHSELWVLRNVCTNGKKFSWPER